MGRVIRRVPTLGYFASPRRSLTRKHYTIAQEEIFGPRVRHRL